jgi:hypothetical protein
VQALSAAAGPLMRTYPERAIDLLNLLLPGIDVNDIWKCTDIFILMSDLLELMPVADLTKQHALTTASKTLDRSCPPPFPPFSPRSLVDKITGSHFSAGRKKERKIVYFLNTALNHTYNIGEQ